MNPVNATQWRFSALDTLFFKESRPMEAVGGAQLQSVFPPPARTLVGAIRTAIGQALHVDWQAYAADIQHPLRRVMGDADSLGPLAFTGPFLLKDKVRLFPVPLALLHAKDSGTEKFTRLLPSPKITVCDLGAVRLPVKRDALAGAQPLEQAFITGAGLITFLQGQMPAANTIHKPSDLFDSEERLGIARDYATHTTGDGLLYQTNHVRPRQSVDIGIVVKGLLCPDLPAQGTCRLGAEGRLASWNCEPAQALPKAKIAGKTVLLMLLTPAQFKEGWLPDGFAPVSTPTGQTAWEGVLCGVPLRLISSVLGKPMREGGWDMVGRAPRTMSSLVPAGSCYFCEVLNGADAGSLSGQQIGQETPFGRGELAVGNW